MEHNVHTHGGHEGLVNPRSACLPSSSPSSHPSPSAPWTSSPLHRAFLVSPLTFLYLICSQTAGCFQDLAMMSRAAAHSGVHVSLWCGAWALWRRFPGGGCWSFCRCRNPPQDIAVGCSTSLNVPYFKSLTSPGWVQTYHSSTSIFQSTTVTDMHCHVSLIVKSSIFFQIMQLMPVHCMKLKTTEKLRKKKIKSPVILPPAHCCSGIWPFMFFKCVCVVLNYLWFFIPCMD